MWQQLIDFAHPFAKAELLAIQLHFRAMANTWPVERPLVQPTSNQPDPGSFALLDNLGLKDFG